MLKQWRNAVEQQWSKKLLHLMDSLMKISLADTIFAEKVHLLQWRCASSAVVGCNHCNGCLQPLQWLLDAIAIVWDYCLKTLVSNQPNATFPRLINLKYLNKSSSFDDKTPSLLFILPYIIVNFSSKVSNSFFKILQNMPKMAIKGVDKCRKV